MAKSNYLRNKLIDFVLRNVAFTSPTKVYLALYTSNPGVDNTGTEVNGGGYGRLEVTFATSVVGATSNSNNLTFPVASAGWGTITYGAIFDSPSGGNLLHFGALSQSKTILTGQVFEIDAGELDIVEN